MSLPPINNTSSQIDQEFTQINQQFQDLSLQYQNASYEYGNTGVETMAGQTTDANVANTYADPIPPYAQPNPYDSHQQPEFYGHTQANESVGSTGYSEQQASYQQQAYNDPLAYGAPAYGSEVSVCFQFQFHSRPIFIMDYLFARNRYLSSLLF